MHSIFTNQPQYAPVIFEESVGLSHSLSLLLSGFNGCAYFLSSLIPIWIIDRLGRRKLMLFAAAGQMACMAILAGTVSNGSKGAGYVATVMLFLFNFFFAVGLLAIPWLRGSTLARFTSITNRISTCGIRTIGHSYPSSIVGKCIKLQTLFDLEYCRFCLRIFLTGTVK